MNDTRLSELAAAGWQLTRDGSTASALRVWDDPEDDASSWEILVLKTEGHAGRFTMDVSGSALTERSLAEARTVLTALSEAVELLENWQGELPPQAD